MLQWDNNKYPRLTLSSIAQHHKLPMLKATSSIIPPCKLKYPLLLNKSEEKNPWSNFPKRNYTSNLWKVCKNKNKEHLLKFQS